MSDHAPGAMPLSRARVERTLAAFDGCDGCDSSIIIHTTTAKATLQGQKKITRGVRPRPRRGRRESNR